LKAYGEAPFEDLAHGVDGIKEDLQSLLGLGVESDVLAYVRLVAMKKREANKERCPCGSRARVGRCHNRSISIWRKRLGRQWFRIVEQQLLSSAPSGKASHIQFWPQRWREDSLLGVLPDKVRRLRASDGSRIQPFSVHEACPSSA